MGSDSSNNDDCQEKGGNDTRNAVKDDHGHGSGRGFSQDIVVIVAAAIAASIDRSLVHMYGCRRRLRIILR